jgi:hypothetical protein
MANPEHLEMLEQGVVAWNQWRVDNVDIRPDLRFARLSGKQFVKANLDNVNLSGADLTNANLRSAGFKGSCLRGASFGYANLSNTNLVGADLAYARLSDANLSYAFPSRANLSGADLSYAHLIGADLFHSTLDKANLVGADFSDAHFVNADLSEVKVGWTTFGNNDLRSVKGLDSIDHIGPSTIGVDTIYRSQGNIPEAFLRGCGVPEDFITYARSLVTKPIQFYSCFISYSSTDRGLAERLHSDLQAKGVRVWFAPHDMKIGARLRPTIDESIRVYDKLLLVLSEASVSSRWVEQEVETALAKEEAGREVLFPVRLDDAVMNIQTGWPALVKRTRHVGDFTRWKEHDSYQKAFGRLLRDLRAEGEETITVDTPPLR